VYVQPNARLRLSEFLVRYSADGWLLRYVGLRRLSQPVEWKAAEGLQVKRILVCFNQIDPAVKFNVA